MGRELRRVPADWQHPKDEQGGLQPLYDVDFATRAAQWKANLAAFDANKPAAAEGCEYWEWENNPPRREYYRPAWPEETRTHYQMYETCTEGTPISPVLPTPEAVARWCADNGASAFGGQTATYEAWMAVCNNPHGCVSALWVVGEGMISGPASLLLLDGEYTR